MNLAEVDSLMGVVPLENGLPSDRAFIIQIDEEGTLAVPFFLDDSALEGFIEFVSREHNIDLTPNFIAGIDSVRQHVSSIPEEMRIMVHQSTADGVRARSYTPSGFLAELPTGTMFGFSYEPTGSERFEPGEVTITPGVHGALGAQVGDIVQRLLSRHLSGDYGDEPRLKEREEPGFKSDWELPGQ